jgi:hypothetical protein
VAIAAVPPHVARFRPDITAIPLHGVEPSHVVPATRVGDRDRLVAAFRKAARALLTSSPAVPESSAAAGGPAGG